MGLLGPRGAGKTTALHKLAEQCGATVVHAEVDLDALAPVPAIVYVVFELMNEWRALTRDPSFHRVGLCLLALNETLPENRDAARERVRALLKDYVRGTRAGRVAEKLTAGASAVVELAADLTTISTQGVTDAIRKRAKPVISAVLQGAAWWNVQGARHWLRTLPSDAADSEIDRLIALSRHRDNVLDHLMGAFLADIDDNVAHISEVRTRCHCVVPSDRADERHAHAWVLLVDNAGSDNGRQFLGALIRARQQRAKALPDRRSARDRLLVVAALDTWVNGWTRWWLEPWHVDEDPGRERIPLFSEVRPAQWAAHIERTGEPAAEAEGWYPVWLDPLDPEEIATLAGTAPEGWDQHTYTTVIGRLSGGRASAVVAITKRIAAQLAEQPPDDHPEITTDRRARELLFQGAVPFWREVLMTYLPNNLNGPQQWQTIPDLVSVLALLNTDRAGNAPAQYLTLLRRHLWLSTFEARPSRLRPVTRDGTRPFVAMQPWLAHCLLAGLWAESPAMARRPVNRSWDNVFAALAGGQDSLSSRRLYHDLARDRFDDVVADLTKLFGTSSTSLDWLTAVDEVTGAPCRLPFQESLADSLGRLLPDEDAIVDTRTIVATCVALLWLYQDPLTVPTADTDRQLRSCFRRLSTRPEARLDADALDAAEDEFR